MNGDRIDCKDGAVFISLYNDNARLQIVSSLNRPAYYEMPDKSIDITEKYKKYILLHDTTSQQWLVKADIISKSAIIVRVFEFDPDEDESESLAFSIFTNHLKEIAIDILKHI